MGARSERVGKMSDAREVIRRQRITGIEVQKGRQDRRSVFVDGKFAFGIEADVADGLGLRVGQLVSEQDLEQISRAELTAKAKHKALKLLEYRQRSRAEIQQRLRRGGFDDNVIGDTLAYLEGLGLIDDEEFARSWVRSRIANKGVGKARIKWELRQKGVSNDLIEQVLSDFDDEAEYMHAMDAARRRWEKDATLDTRRKRQRVASYLRRQGFDWQVVSEVLSRLAGEGDE